MKTLYVLLVLTLIAQCLSTKCVDYTQRPSKAEDCNNRELDSGYYRCCFMEVETKKSGKTKYCGPVTKEQYDDIDDYIDKVEDGAGDTVEDTVEDFSIDCGSNYIVISILSLILLFI